MSFTAFLRRSINTVNSGDVDGALTMSFAYFARVPWAVDSRNAASEGIKVEMGVAAIVALLVCGEAEPGGAVALKSQKL